MEKTNKRAQIGLNTVRAVMVGFLVLLIIGITIALAGVTLRDAVDQVDKLTTIFTNVTTSSVVNGTPGANVTGTGNLRLCVLTVTQASYNATNSTCSAGIAAGNYTVVNCEIRFKGNGSNGQDSSCYNNTIWNITGSYTHSGQVANDISVNVSQGVTGFFNDSANVFNILVAIVILLAIGIAILVVSRFSGGGSSDSDLGSTTGGVGNGGFKVGRGGGGSGSMMGV